MRSARAPSFDHGAALRVPPVQDSNHWSQLCMWLGEDGQPADIEGLLRVYTPQGWVLARPGDWIVLSHSGEFHVAHTGQRRYDA